jgi:hypothetical protein
MLDEAEARARRLLEQAPTPPELAGRDWRDSSTRCVELLLQMDAQQPGSSHTLSIVPRGEGDGFRANVRGHVLDLIDPSSYALAPTTDDLFTVSIAAALAWSARSFLRDHGLPDYVSVSAERRTGSDPSSSWAISLTVTVTEGAESEGAALAAAFEKTLAARLAAEPVIHILFGQASTNA